MRRHFQSWFCVTLLGFIGCATPVRERWTTQPPTPYYAPPQPGQFQHPGQFQQPATFPQGQPQTPSFNPQPGATSQFPMQHQQVDYRWRAPEIKLYGPEPVPGSSNPPTRSPSPEPPVLQSSATAVLPVGIPQFASISAKVSAGLRPMDDGLDWLRAAGYRSVLHVHAPIEDTSADRREVEKRGMTYLELETSPQSLSKDIVESFSRTVGDGSNQPLFVYDRDGALAGGLWYLHFRMADSLPDDAARLRARGLGLREDEGNHRLMWLAVQRILSELPR